MQNTLVQCHNFSKLITTNQCDLFCQQPTPSTSATPPSATLSSATKRKFLYRQISDVSESTEGGDSSTDVKTTILRCAVLSTLVEGLECSLCGCCTLVVRSVGCNLGLVCLLETYCTSCETVLKSTYSSDRVSSQQRAICCDSISRVSNHGHGSGSWWTGEAVSSS